MPARRIDQIGFSPTLAVADLARRLRAEGRDVLDFSAGQPDFPTPEAAKRAGVRAIEDNRTGYTANAGIPELRAAIAARLLRDLGVEFPPEQILVSPGAKASLYFACMALFDPGDEVVVPAPYWTSYPEQLRLAGAEPVFVGCDEDAGFRLTPATLEAALTPRTRGVILNYPSNPTGACYDLDELRPLAELCARRGVWILADEIYSQLLYDGRRFASVAQLGPEVRERTVLIDGMSKTYSMTGWRIGYAAGPAEVIRGMSKLQSHTTSNATSIAQWASVAALEMDGAELERRRDEFQRRRDAALRGLEALPGVTCRRPEGSFYAFPDVSGCLGSRAGGEPVDTPERLCRYLLEAAQVALVPGEAFGSDRHVRLSYTVDVERIRSGIERMGAALEQLRAGRA